MALHSRFLNICDKYENKIGIVDTLFQKEFTYGELKGIAKKFQALVQNIDNDYFAMMLPTSSMALLSFMGTLMAGKVSVHINYSTGAQKNWDYAKSKVGVRHLLTSRGLLQKVGMQESEDMIFIEDLLAAPSPSVDFEIAGITPNKTALILFTSGSENDPKAVQLTHHNLLSNVDGIMDALNLTDEDVYISSLPYFHVYGLTGTGLAPIMSGAKVVTIANPLDFKFTVDCIKDHKATTMISTPSFFAGYMKKADVGDLSSLKNLVAGAETLPKEVYEVYKNIHGVEILEGYGATETSPVVCVNRHHDNVPGSIGLPLQDVEVEIRSLETGEVVPFGEIGKIFVKGPLVMKGYLNDEKRTESVLKDGWYDTGDMGTMDKKNRIWHRGRLKRFTKIAGEMVSLVRVEKELSQVISDLGINEFSLCVVDIPNTFKGVDLACMCTLDLDKEEFRNAFSKEMNRLHIPKYFVQSEEIPLLGSGKINFREVERILREKLA